MELIELKEVLRDKACELIKNQKFDFLALAVIDFSKNSYESFNCSSSRNIDLTKSKIYFDLASVTKPLTCGAIFLKHPEIFDEKMLLLLEHRGNLPAWGRLSRSNWKDVIRKFDIKESSVRYSDFSFLRLMLEIEKIFTEKKFQELASYFWDEEVRYWFDLPKESNFIFPVTGFRNGKNISGDVHDDNAFILNRAASHAGLFATIEGLSKSLLNLNKETAFVVRINEQIKKLINSKNVSVHPLSELNRFVWGWDRAEDLENTLAGKGVSPYTFGHLGFTGTSVWIDSEKQIGYVLLTNGVLNGFYERQSLNTIRRELGKIIWENFHDR